MREPRRRKRLSPVPCHTSHGRTGNACTGPDDRTDLRCGLWLYSTVCLSVCLPALHFRLVLLLFLIMISTLHRLQVSPSSHLNLLSILATVATGTVHHTITASFATNSYKAKYHTRRTWVRRGGRKDGGGAVPLHYNATKLLPASERCVPVTAIACRYHKWEFSGARGIKEGGSKLADWGLIATRAVLVGTGLILVGMSSLLVLTDPDQWSRAMTCVQNLTFTSPITFFYGFVPREAGDMDAPLVLAGPF